jgi:hypothetical protein
METWAEEKEQACQEKIEKEARARKLQLFLIGCFGIAIVLLIRVRGVDSFCRPEPAGHVSGAHPAKKRGRFPEVRNPRAYAMSQRFAKRRLNDPNCHWTFYPITDDRVRIFKLGGGRYRVSAYMLLGGEWAFRYVCTLKDLGHDKWKLEYVETDAEPRMTELVWP